MLKPCENTLTSSKKIWVFFHGNSGFSTTNYEVVISQQSSNTHKITVIYNFKSLQQYWITSHYVHD